MHMPIFSHAQLDDKGRYVNRFFIQTREVDKSFCAEHKRMGANFMAPQSMFVSKCTTG